MPSSRPGARQQIVDAARRLAARGYLPATGGNISLRVPGEAAFAVTPSDLDYGVMTAADVCVLDLDLRVLEGERKPSIESSLHAAVYQARPDIGAVVHTHQPYASALALIDTPIPALFDEQVRHLGRSVEIVPYGPSGTAMLRRKLARRLASHANAYILRNHGAVCLGADLLRAENNVELLEKCSLAYLLALCTERKVSKIPLVVREVAFHKLRKDQDAAARRAAEAGEALR
jgi:ribulose-5-phosphate 4-epimerase/fuculose-1-phosphate aldolase